MLLDPRYIKTMPDIAKTQKSPVNSTLDLVGMENIEVPLLLEDGTKTLANVHVFVNVSDPKAKGIHMSRLYLVVKNAFSKNKFSIDLVKQVLKESVESQQGLSTSAKIEIHWDNMLERKALLSDNSGWKSYPTQVCGLYDGNETTVQVAFSVYYSSACPCSAALSRQLYQKAFEEKFGDIDDLQFADVKEWLGQKQVATPHSQRSRADVVMKLASDVHKVDFTKYIDAIEDSLQTPVQTAVKREDEQEFARLNGENLMFVEDALRKMKHALDEHPEIVDFQVKASHFESLHAHDAVGIVTKNSVIS